MISKISISVAMQASYYKCGVCTWKVRKYVKISEHIYMLREAEMSRLKRVLLPILFVAVDPPKRH